MDRLIPVQTARTRGAVVKTAAESASDDRE